MLLLLLLLLLALLLRRGMQALASTAAAGCMIFRAPAAPLLRQDCGRAAPQKQMVLTSTASFLLQIAATGVVMCDAQGGMWKCKFQFWSNSA
jgi:hypothetical protein